jgi:Na+-translocating ferredoxin:NAD+ oxidoreductase RnfG subunit
MKPTDSKQSRFKVAVLVHVARVALFCGIVLLIHLEHQRFTRLKSQTPQAIELADVKVLFPLAAALKASDERVGALVVDGKNHELGYVLLTSPESDGIVGYSGATTSLLTFDLDDRLLGLRVLRCGDTIEHAAKVRNDERFATSFKGLGWKAGRAATEIDAVSGATLTSLAVIEGVATKLNGERPSLRFPPLVAISEVRELFPEAERLVANNQQPGFSDVFNADGQRLGSILRTSPRADQELGYQGPSDSLLAFDETGKATRFIVRQSYDNQPYVGYVRDEASFQSVLAGLTVGELARIDPKQTEIEGVSGATMTSLAVIRGLSKATRGSLEVTAQSRSSSTIRMRDAGTLLVLVTACVFGFTRLRGSRLCRTAFQLIVIAYLGFMNGDMFSQAQLVGWAQNGVPWGVAPGLILLSGAALVLPVFTKRQVYCQQICPFGAAQQLIHDRVKYRSPLAQRWAAKFKWLPAALLGVVVTTAMWHGDLNLTALEPFDAFALGVAGIATSIVAVVGLITSAFVPMAYCRYGCPTGAMLNFLRFSARSHEFSRRDALAIALLVIAGLRFWFG